MDDELRALRARAYGPGADIADDASALRRLQELEGVASRQSAETLEPPEVDVAETPSTNAPLPDERDQSQVDTPMTRQRWRRPALWSGSIIASILVTAGASWMLIQPISPDPQGVGAQQVARLPEDPGIALPEFFVDEGPNGSRAFRVYNGLQIVVGPEAFGRGLGDEECLSVLKRSDLDSATATSFSGSVYSGCAANDFPATVSIKVNSDMPRQLRDEFAEGTALQFVYDERRSDVVVFSSPK